MSYVVWSNHHFYYPYKVKTAYLRLNMQDGGYNWTLDKNQASQFINVQEAVSWCNEINERSGYDARNIFDIVIGVGRV